MARVRKPKGSRFVHRGQTGKRAKGGLRCRFLLEGLEARELLSFDAHVNFQPAGRPVPNGYVADTGDAFGQRSGGLQFGWDKSGIDIFDRWTSADDLHDTTAAMQWQGNYTWEMAVPSGTYKVHLSAGDANSWNDLQKINVEGVTVVNAVTTQDQRWVEGTATVTVTDGRLTVTSPSTTSRNAIDFIDVTSSDGATPPPVVPPPPVTPPPVTPPPVTPPPTDPPPPPATGSTIKVNFQPAGLPVVPGYLPDVGQLYGNRGNGAEYGWTTSGINLFDRWANPDPLRDHFAAMQWQGNYTWEIGLANGTYQVHIVSGDANSWNETMRITAEGQAVVNATTTAGNRWVEGTATVTVSDGRLTIGNATGATSNNINYIEITPTSGGGTTTPTTNPTTPTTPTNPTPPPTTPTQPGAAVVGTNIDGLADWATVSPLIDITSQFRQWGNITKTYEADPNLPLTADNYPLVDAGSISYVYGYPDGRYKVSYDGIGSLAFSGMNAKYTVVFHTGDHWGGYLDITPQTSKGAILEIRLTGINPANPVHNLHILSPDADPAVSDTFRPVFLKKLMPFNGPLRVMDWMQTNDTPAANWQDRTKTTRFSYTNDTGVPYETIAKLANTLNMDLWINVPYHATEDYVRQMARFFRDNVNPNLHIYVEYSNEVWNSGFEQMRANQAAAWADNSLTKTDDFGRQAQKFGRLTGRAAQIFKEEFGAAYASRVRFELGGLIAGSYWAQTALQQIQSSYGDPKSLLYGIAVAPYVGVQGDMDAIDNASLTMQGLFDWMNNWIDGPITTWTRDHKRLADAYGLKLDSYEGGQSLSYINGKNEALKISAQDDARMGLMYQHLITTWTKESGGGVFGNFALATQKGPWGSWGVLESIDQPTSVKYQAVTSMAGKVV